MSGRLGMVGEPFPTEHRSVPQLNGTDPCSVPLSWGKKVMRCSGGVFDLAAEQLQQLRKLPENKTL